MLSGWEGGLQRCDRGEVQARPFHTDKSFFSPVNLLILTPTLLVKCVYFCFGGKSYQSPQIYNAACPIPTPPHGHTFRLVQEMKGLIVAMCRTEYVEVCEEVSREECVPVSKEECSTVYNTKCVPVSDLVCKEVQQWFAVVVVVVVVFVIVVVVFPGAYDWVHIGGPPSMWECVQVNLKQEKLDTNSKLTSFTLYNSQGRMLSGGRGSLWNGVSARLQEGSSTIS